MTEVSKHSGGCHCGRVRYDVTVPLDRVMSCNCSICQKRGSLLTFVKSDAFNLLSGDDALADYQFNKMIIHHLFCRHCGVASFARGTRPDGSDMIAVNVRCLDDVDPAALSPMPFDGRSL
jgi:hypothetical protein